MNDEPVFHVRVRAPTVGELRAFADSVPADLGCRPVVRRSEGDFVLDVYLSEAVLREAQGRRANVSLEVLENMTEAGRQRQAEVGQGNRFEARADVPRGLGRKE